MTTALPNWVYDLVSAVETYEFEHGQTTDGWPCLGAALEDVPAEVRQGARAISAYRAGRGEITRPVPDGVRLKNREHRP